MPQQEREIPPLTYDKDPFIIVEVCSQRKVEKVELSFFREGPHKESLNFILDYQDWIDNYGMNEDIHGPQIYKIVTECLRRHGRDT